MCPKKGLEYIGCIGDNPQFALDSTKEIDKEDNEKDEL